MALSQKHAQRALSRILPRTVKCGRCLLWQGARTETGYGRIGIRYKTFSVHRVVWTARHGAIPNGKMICHKCDTPNCVNHRHLFIGTQADNLRDMRAKGRARLPLPKSGEDHHAAVLSDNQVRKIRKIAGSMSQRAIAKKFKCRQSTVWRIIHNLTRLGANNA